MIKCDVNKYVKKIGRSLLLVVRALLLGIGLIWGMALVAMVSMSFPFVMDDPLYVTFFLIYLSLLAIWLLGLFVFSRFCYKKSLLAFIILCIFVVVGKWYWEKCPSDKPLMIEGQCYSCWEPQDIPLVCELTPKQLNMCPNRKVIMLQGIFYSVIPRKVSYEPEGIVLDGGYWRCPRQLVAVEKTAAVLLWCTLFSLVLIWGVLYPRKKKNG